MIWKIGGVGLGYVVKSLFFVKLRNNRVVFGVVRFIWF